MSVFAGRPIEVEFHGVLRPPQKEAVAQILRNDDGLICAPTAFGKTAVAAWLIAKRKVNTLVMVHRQQLLDQWRERLAMLLEFQSTRSAKSAVAKQSGGRSPLVLTGRTDHLSRLDQRCRARFATSWS